ncbi:hypothetical protein [Kutzneria sp. CA-103260]|uniref:hypothetical protein n=1 Tax=Kutzneria sp. CA-103260 TaxID=2802641 RepID=UPI001BA4F4EA|nr:hypothetical protein [Kutzneria sp. CA-103260]QUQ68873.1 hypothetical protein JJ691_66200 [Kutzneria sp. CA-103260]
MRKSRITLGVLALALSLPAIPATATPTMKADAIAKAATTAVLLPNGDHVVVRSVAGGATSAAVVPNGGGVAHTYIGITLHGDQ